MTNELTVKQENSLTTASLASYTRAQIEIFKSLCARGANDMELAYFLSTAQQLGLDPRLGQIYCVPRWDSASQKNVYVPTIGVAGYRVLAERTGEYCGSTEPEFCGKDGKWTDNWCADEIPVKCRVGVMRKGWVVQYAHAYYASRVQRRKDGAPNEMWQKDPLGQLAKCAEVLAFKKAFPTTMANLRVASMEDLVVEETPERIVVKPVDIPPTPVLPDTTMDRWEFSDVPDVYLPPDLQGKAVSFERLGRDENLFYASQGKPTKARAVIHRWATGQNWPEALRVIGAKLLEKYPSKKPEQPPESGMPASQTQE